MSITTAHSALSDLSQAVATALKASTTFTSISSGIGPHDPPKEIQSFPFVSFGEHSEQNWYTFGNTGREVFFVIEIWSQQLGKSSDGFKEAYTILDTITGILEAQMLTLTNFEMAGNGFMFESSSKMLESDGVTKHVTARYHTWLRAK